MHGLDQAYTLVGLGLIVAGLVIAFKIGAWVWLMTRVLHKPIENYPARSRSSEVSAAPDAIKKWLSVIAATLGIISTSVGLTKSCAEPQAQQAQQIPGQQPVQPALSAICCTSAGSCPMMMAGPVGTACFCADLFGNTAQGSVCQ